jgi:hypothetical protein
MPLANPQYLYSRFVKVLTLQGFQPILIGRNSSYQNCENARKVRHFRLQEIVAEVSLLVANEWSHQKLCQSIDRVIDKIQRLGCICVID